MTRCVECGEVIIYKDPARPRPETSIHRFCRIRVLLEWERHGNLYPGKHWHGCFGCGVREECDADHDGVYVALYYCRQCSRALTTPLKSAKGFIKGALTPG